MPADEHNLKLLGIFHYIMGGITALTSCVFLIHIGIGIAMLAGGFAEPDPPPMAVGLLFTLIPGLLMLAGWTMAALIIVAGRKLQKRQSHTFCLVIAALQCLNMPLGTILGVFTIIVLMKEPVRDLFESAAA